uniref:Uncharacterized protein n=1 Tax=Caenorhabditis tropicalis TaxID=1561998 RepID=A0A1I7TNR6_9PELO
MFQFIFIFTVFISCSSEIPYVKYCRHKSTGKCAAVDIWFGQYEFKRLFPMKCLKDSCPNGFVCEQNEKCWNEVKSEDYCNKKCVELELVNGEWELIKLK